jgi:hypothetical protein
MPITLDGTNGVTTPAVDTQGNLAYTGTLTGGTGVINIGSGQVYKDASGNVGFGTSSPATGLSLLKYGSQWTNNTFNTYPQPAGNTFLQMEALPGQTNWFGFTGGYGATSGSANLLLQVNFNNANQQAGNYIASEAQSATAADLTFGKMIGGATTGANSAKSEFMRIDSSGNLLVGRTSAGGYSANSVQISQDGGGSIFDVTSNTPIFVNRRTSTGELILFSYNQNTVGTVSTNGTTTSYNTSSDYRLKHDIQPMTGALAKVAQLKPVTYKWNADDSQSQGFIAHELQEVVPECVTGEKDAVEIVEVKDENGEVIGTEERPVYQGIDTSFLVATLTAALQEAVAEINSLKARVEALEGAQA